MYISPPPSVSPQSLLINPGEEQGSSFPLIAPGVYFKTSMRCRNASSLTLRVQLLRADAESLPTGRLPGGAPGGCGTWAQPLSWKAEQQQKVSAHL